MAKLFFKYGTMGSGKSLDLLKVSYNYDEHGRNAVIITSKIDDRYGNDIVKSRTGIEKEAISVNKKDNIYNIIVEELKNNNIDCVLVDEVQFFNKKQMYQLLNIVDKLDIPVICYGLRTDFKLKPFKSIKYLMSIADEIEELKTICSVCGKKKASVNARFDENDNIIIKGKQIEIGGNDKYKPLCRICFNKIKYKNYEE